MRRRSSGGGGGGGGGTGYRPYVSTSAFNTPIPAGVAIHPQTSSMISATSHWLLAGGAYDAYKTWLGPRQRLLYYRGDTSALSTVPVYANWTPTGGFACATTPTLNMPMPSNFASVLVSSSIDADRFVCVVDSVTGDVWEAAQMTPPGTAPTYHIVCDSSRWNVNEGLNYYPQDTVLGTGYAELGNTGQIHLGFPSESHCHAPSGILIPEDFADCFTGSDPGTAVEHRIYFITEVCQNGAGTFPKFVAPARGGVGTSESLGIPYGAVVQLDPSLDIANWPSLNALSSPWREGAKKLCRGLQKYGMQIQDDTGGIGAGGLSACNASGLAPYSYNGQTGWKYPWDAAGYGWSYANGLPYDLMSHFQVVDWNFWTGT